MKKLHKMVSNEVMNTQRKITKDEFDVVLKKLEGLRLPCMLAEEYRFLLVTITFYQLQLYINHYKDEHGRIENVSNDIVKEVKQLSDQGLLYTQECNLVPAYLIPTRQAFLLEIQRHFMATQELFASAPPISSCSQTTSAMPLA